MAAGGVSNTLFQKALNTGRPPNIRKLFPNSQALIVSGKAIDRALRQRGRAMTIAANGRSHIVIRGALRAAKRADAAVILEIAKSEGGAKAYCPTSLWNLARQVDAIANEIGSRAAVAIHADHYGIKSADDVSAARTEIPSLFDAGVTSIAIDASHLPDDKNLLANLALTPLIPAWAGYETEVGEIKGKEGLSTPQEALFLIQGLNAHGWSPDWIALNNGTTHGIEATGGSIQVGLTSQIHETLAPYHVSGAQHGTSGNNYDKLRDIALRTHTTKANVATALQMISWGVKVNEFGNAELDAQGAFVKLPGQGVTEELWDEMMAYAAANNLKGGNVKKLNLPFENRILGQPAEVRERMAQAVEDFVFKLLTEVFNAQGTAGETIGLLTDAGSWDLGPKADRIEDPNQWTEEAIRARAEELARERGPAGDYED